MKVSIDEMLAGLVLDTEIAKAIGRYTKDFVPPYSFKIEQAWELLAYAAADGWRLELNAKLFHRNAIRGYSASFDRLEGDDTVYVSSMAETAPLAICRAFLKANGVEEIEYETG